MSPRTHAELRALLDDEIRQRPWLGEPTCEHVHHGSYHCGEPECRNYIGKQLKECL